MSIQAQAEAAAMELLDQLRIDHHQRPIDPISIAFRLGIGVWTSALPDNVAGSIQRVRGNRPEIYLNASDHRRRQRFTCAHELGHWDDNERSGGALQYLDRRDDVAGRGTDPREIYANSFAAALLMPAESVAALKTAGYLVDQLAEMFDVSKQAMQNRLLNLRIA